MMNNLRIALLAAVAALSLTACLDDAAPAGDDDTIVDMGKVDGSADQSPTSTAEHGRQGVCFQLPHDGTACAFACDPDALINFIPEGTCASFQCTLTNGQAFTTGGCNL